MRCQNGCCILYMLARKRFNKLVAQHSSGKNPSPSSVRGVSPQGTIVGSGKFLSSTSEMSHYARAQPAREKRSHGHPIQIYTEILDVGKSLSGSKKRIRWRFGWSESPEEQEIELIHSVVSGKKTIIEDGNEIHSQTSLLEAKFNHAWHSHGLYVFRVEAHMSMMEEAQYFLSIDGIRFMDWPRKDGPRRPKEANRGRYSSEDRGEDEERDYGRGGNGRGAEASSNRPAQQQGVGDRRSAPPAGNGRQQQQQYKNNNHHHQHEHQEQQPQQRQQQQRQMPISPDDDSTFDPFAPSAAKTNAYDPFAQAPPTPAVQAAATKSRSRTASSSAEPQLFDAFDAAPAPRAASTRGASFDAFSIPSSSSGSPDPFASQAQAASPSFAASQASPAPQGQGPSPGGQSRPKAASADLLSMDFVGMSFSPPPPVPTVPPVPPTVAAPVPAAAHIDPWNDTKLVNLDLSGKISPAQANRSPSPISGPSLNNLMGNNAAPISFAQATVFPQSAPAPAPVDPFGAPALLPPSMPPRPVVPTVAPVFSKASAISGMGGGAPPPNPFASMMRPAGTLQPGMMPMGGAAMSAPPAMPQFMAARPNPYAAMAPQAPGAALGQMQNRGLSIPPVHNPYGKPAAPASSLDSIDWKS